MVVGELVVVEAAPLVDIAGIFNRLQQYKTKSLVFLGLSR